MKYLSIFASVLLATASAYGQSGESCRTASDPTLQKPELYAGYDCVNLLDSTAVTVRLPAPVLSRSAKSSKL